jgi:hypothetical protein
MEKFIVKYSMTLIGLFMFGSGTFGAIINPVFGFTMSMMLMMAGLVICIFEFPSGTGYMALPHMDGNT